VGCLKLYTFWQKGKSWDSHFLAKRQKLGLSLSGKKAKVWATLHLAGQVLLTGQRHEPEKCISTTEQSSALVWFGLLG